MERLTDDRFLKDGFYQPKSKDEEKEIRSMGNDLTFEKLYRHCAELEKKNVELQKQVDEWNSAFIQTRAREQAVKDTAKSILGVIMKVVKNTNGRICEEAVQILVKQYGVEV